MAKHSRKAEVVFFPGLGMGHITPCFELARRIVQRDARFLATFLNIHIPDDPALNAYIQSRAASVARVRVHNLTAAADDLPHDPSRSALGSMSLYIQQYQQQVKEAIASLMSESDAVTVAALFIGMYSTSMIDVAKELGIPCYLAFGTTAAVLGFVFHLPSFDEIKTAAEFAMPSFANPVPRRYLPPMVMNEDGYNWYLHHSKRFRETKAIVVNSCQELETHALRSFSAGSDAPPVYPVGPLIGEEGRKDDGYFKIMEWLDRQPPKSVVFLCFGSMLAFPAAQVMEIAKGLERSGHRFLWSLRRPAGLGERHSGGYANFEEVLPDGFLERTEGRGMVCGWAPQVAVLAHKAVGGFLNQAGWNSAVESVWHGVAMATWPMMAEQNLISFLIGKELGLGVEMNKEEADVVSAEEVERVIGRLMDGGGDIRRNAKEMREKCRKAVMEEDGCSWIFLARLIDELMENV